MLKYTDLLDSSVIELEKTYLDKVGNVKARRAATRYHLPLNKKVRQQPTFPTRVSIIGVRELDFRVRDGNGYSLSTMATGQFNTFVQSYPVSDKRIGTRYKK